MIAQHPKKIQLGEPLFFLFVFTIDHCFFLIIYKSLTMPLHVHPNMFYIDFKMQNLLITVKKTEEENLHILQAEPKTKKGSSKHKTMSHSRHCDRS